MSQFDPDYSATPAISDGLRRRWAQVRAAIQPLAGAPSEDPFLARLKDGSRKA